MYICKLKLREPNVHTEKLKEDGGAGRCMGGESERKGNYKVDTLIFV